MRNKFNTFLFGCTIVLAMLAVIIIPLVIGGCLAASEPRHYYKIQRLNINGEVQQTYYSTSYPWGTGYISFREFPSGKDVKFSAPYTAEDIGTNKPTL